MNKKIRSETTTILEIRLWVNGLWVNVLVNHHQHAFCCNDFMYIPRQTPPEQTPLRQTHTANWADTHPGRHSPARQTPPRYMPPNRHPKADPTPHLPSRHPNRHPLGKPPGRHPHHKTLLGQTAPGRQVDTHTSPEQIPTPQSYIFLSRPLPRRHSPRQPPRKHSPWQPPKADPHTQPLGRHLHWTDTPLGRHTSGQSPLLCRNPHPDTDTSWTDTFQADNP